MRQAYKYTDLYNKVVQQEVAAAFEARNIGAETFKKILEAHTSSLYTPNFFIRIALGLLTVVAVLFSCLLLWLISGASGDAAVIVLCLFSGLLCYTVLELLIKQKQYYNAGVDNILMCSSLLFFISAFFIKDFIHNDVAAGIGATIFCFWLCIRFTDGFMAMLSCISLYIVVLLLCSKAGLAGQAVAPFALMLLCAILYLIATALLKSERLLFYHFSCRAVRLLALVLFYISVNYFVVSEAGKEMFSAPNMPAAFSAVYWIFTVLIPLAYIVYGILKKDLLFIRVGLVLAMATIFTIYYYYDLLPAEIIMLTGGLLLTIISYALIKYLRTPKHGFSFENTNRNKKDLLNVEALIIAQVFGKSNTKHKGFDFGGGSSGGGGASGNY